MIFQPTNVTPDLLGGVENGVVFIQSGSGGTVTVSWQVNGNTPLYAYQIDFFQMDALSTPAGSTGQVNVAPAFSGVDAYGNVQRFSVSLPYSLFSGAAVAANNYEGKFQITQWYNAARTESVAQRSMSVFRLVAQPSASIIQVSGVGGVYRFAGSASIQSTGYQPVAVEWARWYVYNETRGRSEQDTGKVYGANSAVSVWETNRLNPGDTYHAVYSVGTSVGYVASAIGNSFTALEGYIETTGGITPYCDRTKRAVRLDTIPYEDLPATVTGEYSWYGEKIFLPMGSSAKWNPPSLSDAQWSFLWQATLFELNREQGAETQTLFQIRQSNGTVFAAEWDPATERIIFTPHISGETSIAWKEGDTIAVLLSEENSAFTIKASYKYPDSSSFTISAPISDYSLSPISSVEIGGGTKTEFWCVSYGPDSSPLSEAFANWEEPNMSDRPHLLFEGKDASQPEVVRATAFYFSLGANAGWTMYRKDSSGNVVHVANFSYAEDIVPVSVYDYGAVNGETYFYYVLSTSEDGENGYVALSGEVSPCFWDWALIQAEENAADELPQIGGKFNATQVFLFSANVSTGQTGNGNSPSVQSTFTRYPAVLRDTQNRQAGTLSGLIGSVRDGVYKDTNATRDAIWGLSTSPLPLFLRNRRGDFLRAAIAGEITMDTADNSQKQQLTATVPWIEVGPADETVSEMEYSSIDPPGDGGDGE